MPFDRTAILEEFAEYSTVDYRDNYSIGEIFEQFGGFYEYASDNRGFSIITKRGYYETDAGIIKHEKIQSFALLLKDHGNIEYARKMSGLGYHLAKYYIDFLNKAAEDRGLPPIFQRKRAKRRNNSKLTEKQVSYIKHLINKYSTAKVAAMYSVSQATISQIKKGDTWKDTPPAIQSNKMFLKYSNPRYENKIAITIITPTESELKQRLINNRWGANNVMCPYCKSTNYYWDDRRNQFICALYSCRYRFSHITKTLYENTKSPLTLWYIIEKLTEQGGVSGAEIARIAGTTQKTVSIIQAKIKIHPFKSLLLSDFTIPINM